MLTDPSSASRSPSMREPRFARRATRSTSCSRLHARLSPAVGDHGRCRPASRGASRPTDQGRDRHQCGRGHAARGGLRRDRGEPRCPRVQPGAAGRGARHRDRSGGRTRHLGPSLRGSRQPAAEGHRRERPAVRGRGRRWRGPAQRTTMARWSPCPRSRHPGHRRRGRRVAHARRSPSPTAGSPAKQRPPAASAPAACEHASASPLPAGVAPGVTDQYPNEGESALLAMVGVDADDCNRADMDDRPRLTIDRENAEHFGIESTRPQLAGHGGRHVHDPELGGAEPGPVLGDGTGLRLQRGRRTASHDPERRRHIRRAEWRLRGRRTGVRQVDLRRLRRLDASAASCTATPSWSGRTTAIRSSPSLRGATATTPSSTPGGATTRAS